MLDLLYYLCLRTLVNNIYILQIKIKFDNILLSLGGFKMQTQKNILSKNGYNISTTIFLPENKHMRAIIIACHGFGGDKESSAIYLLAQKLNKINIGVIAFDFPAHGESEVSGERFTVSECIQNIKDIENYIKQEYKDIKIGIFSTSFGAYITLLKILQQDNFFTIVLRAPAICMDEILINSILKESMEDFKNRGYTILGYEKSMEVYFSFYEELVENNILEKFNRKRKMLIVQGTEDDMAPISDTIKFINKNEDAILEKIVGADHRMKKEGELEKAINIAVDYIISFL